jgi:hypothetical protein
MGEFLQNYGLFILVALVMVFCHMGHGSHGRKDRDPGQRGPGVGRGSRHG